MINRLILRASRSYFKPYGAYKIFSLQAVHAVDINFNSSYSIPVRYLTLDACPNNVFNEKNELYLNLCIWRRKIGLKLSTHPSRLCTEKVLQALTIQKPTSIEELTRILKETRGNTKIMLLLTDIETWGADVLTIIAESVNKSNSHREHDDMLDISLQLCGSNIVKLEDLSEWDREVAQRVLTIMNPNSSKDRNSSATACPDNVLQNVFISGSNIDRIKVLSYIIQALLRNKSIDKTFGSFADEVLDRHVGFVAVTSVTKYGAHLLGGDTFSDFAMIHKFDISGTMGTMEEIMRKITSRIHMKSNARKLKQWKALEVLVINEISLLSPLTFTLLDKVARYIRKCDKPFGGVKVIAAGDFLEHTPALPSLSTPECGTAGNLFCFQTPSWNDFGFQGNTFLLNPVENMNTLYSAEEGVSSTSNSLGFVCKYEATYRQILDAIHNGRLTMDMLNLLNTCDVKYKKRPDESISNSNEDLEVLPMKLYTDARSVNKVEAANASNFQSVDNSLGSPYIAEDFWLVEQLSPTRISKTVKEELKKSMSQNGVPDVLRLKRGAQVIVLSNIPCSDVLSRFHENAVTDNIAVPCGAQGVLIDFDTRFGNKYPIVKFSNGVVAIVNPVDWLHTNHNSGAMSYTGYRPTAREDVRNIVRHEAALSTIATGASLRAAFRTSTAPGVTLVRRQIPLKLAWALHLSECDLISRTARVTGPVASPIIEVGSRTTTNLSQYSYASCNKYSRIELVLKLPKIRMDAYYREDSDKKYCGLLYNALSRVTSMEGLWLSTPLSPRWMGCYAHPDAIQFYRIL